MYIGIDDISCGCTTNRIVNWLELEKKNKSNEYASTLSIRCGMLTPEIQLGYLFGCCMGFLNTVQIQHMYSLCFRIPYYTDSRGRWSLLRTSTFLLRGWESEWDIYSPWWSTVGREQPVIRSDRQVVCQQNRWERQQGWQRYRPQQKQVCMALISCQS